MHDDLKSLLLRGWQFGVRFDDAAEVFRATGKLGSQTVRGSAVEPMQAMAIAMLEAQRIEMEAVK